MSDADWWASKNEIFPLELRHHLPYKYRKTPGFLDGKFEKKVLVEGVVLVAMKDLENEEVRFSISSRSSRDRHFEFLVLMCDKLVMAWGMEFGQFSWLH